jgi:acyl-CoA synthetase (AMP-forming)/AMP-acid ligase II
VVDPASGEDVASGQVGELWVRGPNVVRGYWNKPEETAASFTEGWFHTGDLGYMDDDGLVYVVDRLKDVVIRGGENVYCAEVEAVLFEHPAVDDVAVIGLPDELLGEEVAAIVNPKPDASADGEELRAHAAEHLAGFKVPGVIVFRDAPLPRTATGKVLKRELREEIVRAGTVSS